MYDEQYETVKEAAEAVRENLHGLDHVHSVGIGPEVVDGERTDNLAVVVWVDAKLSEDELDESQIVPKTVGGVPTDVQQVDPPKAQISSNHRRQPHEPVFGGISCSHPGATAGTIGGIFEDDTGQPVALTNRHVASDSELDPTGDQCYQPGVYDTSSGDPYEVMGTVKEVSPWDLDGVNTNDSALIDPSSATVNETTAGVGTVGAPEEPSFDETYIKSGRTTHLTASKLQGRDFSTRSIEYPSWGITIDYTDLLVFDPVSLGGDSGSIFGRYDRATDTHHPMGLLFAGSDSVSLAIPWASVTADHGTLTPVDFGTTLTPQEAAERADIAPVELETDSSGRLPVVLYNAGGITTKTARLHDGSTTGTVLEEENTDLGYAETGVVDLDMGSHYVVGTHTVTLESNSGDTTTYSVEVTEQTEYKVTITVENSVGDSLTGATVTAIETGRVETTDTNGEAAFYLADGSYTFKADLSGYDQGSGSVTVNGTEATETIVMPDETSGGTEDTTGRDWSTVTNPNPYPIKYEYVGVQDLYTSYTGYEDRPKKSEADIVVSTVSELSSAFDTVVSGETIWVEYGEYNVDGVLYREDLPTDATLASDGARLHSPNGINGILQLTNDGARVTGLRFEGDQETGAASTDYERKGILLQADVLVDNCEFYRWQVTAIYVGFSSSTPSQVLPTIRHCIVRDCRTDGLGYGIVTYYKADPLIEYCFINNCREGVASNGNDTASYRAQNNLHGPDADVFAFECHEPGGVRMDISNNEFHLVERNDGTMIGRSYAQRGTPTNNANLQDNWFYNPNPPDPNDPGASGTAISQTNHGSASYVNVTWSNNSYGTTEPTDSTIGIQALTDQNTTTDPDSTLESQTLTWTSKTDWDAATSRSGLVSNNFGDRNGGSVQLGWDPDQPPLSTKGVAYWPLDGSGSTMVDAIGTADGQLVAGTPNQPGVNRSTAVDFNGVDDHVLVSGTDVGSFSGSFAVTAVVTPQRVDRNQCIFRNGFTDAGTVFLTMRDNGRLSLGFYDSSNNVHLYQNFFYGILEPGTTYLLTGSYNASAGEFRAWMDTEAEVESASGTRPARATGHDAFIGYRADRADRAYRGLAEEVVLFDQHLTNTDVQNLYNSFSSGSIALARQLVQ